MDTAANSNLAYVVGVALGDGNLSCPNKRATRLRVTCDARYESVAQEIASALQKLFPHNKVSKVNGPKSTYFNISVYSNKLNQYIPWKVGGGSKYKQNAQVPKWIFNERDYIRACLLGLLQTDGSIYLDRGYKMINFTNNISGLTENVKTMMESLGYRPRIYTAKQKSGILKHTVRLSRGVEDFISEIGLHKDTV